jgi:hypothetical protein
MVATIAFTTRTSFANTAMSDVERRPRQIPFRIQVRALIMAMFGLSLIVCHFSSALIAWVSSGVAKPFGSHLHILPNPLRRTLSEYDKVNAETV